MNVARPFVAAARFVAFHAGSLLQVAGLAALIVACGLVWGAVGGLVAGGVSLVTVGVALERGE